MTHVVDIQEEEAAETAVKGAKQASNKPRKSKKAAKKASRTAASSRAEIAPEAAAAEQPATQHAAPCDDALHDLPPLSQPDADAGVQQAPLHAEDQADDSWQLCPLSKVCHAMLQTSRMFQLGAEVVKYVTELLRCSTLTGPNTINMCCRPRCGTR